MEPQQHQNQHHQPNGNCGGSGKGNCHCRPTCPRWTPTTDQVRILKELYYNNGVRSPTAEQIQNISARLRQYGKIEGKNVFYWFQNYKARERLKKKIEGNTTTITTDVSTQRAANTAWKHEEIMNKPLSQNISSVGVSTPSSTFTVYTVGQMGDHGYGPLIMEKSFRDCSISSGGSDFGGARCQNIGWVGIDPHPSSYIYFGVKKEEDIQEEEDVPDIETLPLFPMHGEDDINNHRNSHRNSSNYYSGWYGSDDGGSSSSSSSASLELTLNSYNGRSPSSM